MDIIVPEITVEEVTPDLAKEWLLQNRENRSLRRRKVAQYASQMTRKQWLLTGDPIRFDQDGRLLDGQHRLSAIVQSNVTVTMVVMRGLLTETFKVIDAGMTRSVGDALGFAVPNRSRKAAICRLVYTVRCGGDPRITDDLAAVTRLDATEFYTENAGMVDAATTVAGQLYGLYRGGNVTAWGAFACEAWTACGETSSLPGDFFDSIRSGANLGAGDPRLALRNWLANDRPLPNAGHHLHLLVKTWNAWLRGETRQIVITRGDEPWPEMLAERTAQRHILTPVELMEETG